MRRLRAVSLAEPGRFGQAVVGWDETEPGFFLKCFRRPTHSIESTAGAELWMTGLSSLAALEAKCAGQGLELSELVRLYLLTAQRADQEMLQSLAASLGELLCS
ncbi:MAG: hypothetical protein JWN04_6924 [Myxococcaceae bacterium]|nr:hypothetical protein [Myxococcaceae bacterium]